MFSKSNLLSTLFGGIFLFFGGYLIWGVLTVDFFNSHAGTATGVMRENPDMVHLAIACLLQAFFLALFNLQLILQIFDLLFKLTDYITMGIIFSAIV